MIDWFIILAVPKQIASPSNTEVFPEALIPIKPLAEFKYIFENNEYNIFLCSSATLCCA